MVKSKLSRGVSTSSASYNPTAHLPTATSPTGFSKNNYLTLSDLKVTASKYQVVTQTLLSAKWSVYYIAV
jgi:hypothetical protein